MLCSMTVPSTVALPLYRPRPWTFLGSLVGHSQSLIPWGALAKSPSLQVLYPLKTRILSYIQAQDILLEWMLYFLQVFWAALITSPDTVCIYISQNWVIKKEQGLVFYDVRDCEVQGQEPGPGEALLHVPSQSRGDQTEKEQTGAVMPTDSNPFIF